MQDLTGQVAWIAGAGSGIGRAMAPADMGTVVDANVKGPFRVATPILDTRPRPHGSGASRP